MAGFTDDLLDVISAIGRPCHLVGHSFGGLVGRSALLARPLGVASLTLMDSGPAALPQSQWPTLQALIRMVPVATMQQIWLAKLELDRQQGLPPLPPAVEEFLHRRWISNDAWSMAGIAQILMTAPDLTEGLARTLRAHALPALVMYGEWDDTAWPIGLQLDMAARLSAPAIGIRGAAHSPAVENPVDTADELVRFITNQHV